MLCAPKRWMGLQGYCWEPRLAEFAEQVIAQKTRTPSDLPRCSLGAAETGSKLHCTRSAPSAECRQVEGELAFRRHRRLRRSRQEVQVGAPARAPACEAIQPPCDAIRAGRRVGTNHSAACTTIRRWSSRRKSNHDGDAGDEDLEAASETTVDVGFA